MRPITMNNNNNATNADYLELIMFDQVIELISRKGQRITQTNDKYQ